eukprot:gene10947-7600_t
MHTSNQELCEPKIEGDFKIYSISGTHFEVPRQYTVLKFLGLGAYGLACSCLDNVTKQKVCIKKCRDILRDEEDGKRVLREIAMMRYFNHENLLSVITILPPLRQGYETLKDIYVVTPLMDVDLNVVLRSRQGLEESHKQYFVYQILRGLKYLHSANVAHRDLKPANLVTNISCDLKIIDFGLSRSVDVPFSDLTDYVITRWYRPPELLLENTNYTTAVDIWSVGCIFAEMYNRKPIFPGRNTMDQLRLICKQVGKPPEDCIERREAVEKLRELPAGRLNIPALVPGLAGNRVGMDFLAKMLELDPRRRPTAADMLAHPYLASLHDETDEPSCPAPFNWPYEKVQMQVPDLRRAFWKDIVRYNPQLADVLPKHRYVMGDGCPQQQQQQQKCSLFLHSGMIEKDSLPVFFSFCGWGRWQQHPSQVSDMCCFLVPVSSVGGLFRSCWFIYSFKGRPLDGTRNRTCLGRGKSKLKRERSIKISPATSTPDGEELVCVSVWVGGWGSLAFSTSSIHLIVEEGEVDLYAYWYWFLLFYLVQMKYSRIYIYIYIYIYLVCMRGSSTLSFVYFITSTSMYHSTDIFPVSFLVVRIQRTTLTAPENRAYIHIYLKRKRGIKRGIYIYIYISILQKESDTQLLLEATLDRVPFSSTGETKGRANPKHRIDLGFISIYCTSPSLIPFSAAPLTAVVVVSRVAALPLCGTTPYSPSQYISGTFRGKSKSQKAKKKGPMKGGHFGASSGRAAPLVWVALVALVLLALPLQWIAAEAALTFTTGSVVDASMYQAVTFTIISNPLTNDPVITTADKLFLVLSSESGSACTTAAAASASVFPIAAVSTGGYSGSATIPITPSMASVGQRYVVCFLSTRTTTAIVVPRGYTGEGASAEESTVLIWPAVYEQYQLSPTTAAPAAGAGPVGLTVTQTAFSNRPLNQALSGSYTVLLVSCPSASVCAAGVSAALVEHCATEGSAYLNSISAGTSYDPVAVIPLSGLKGQSSGAVYGTFVAPFAPSSAGYTVCVPYCATASCQSAAPTFTLVASGGNPSLTIDFVNPNPTLYTRTPAQPQAREDGVITFTGTGFTAQDQVRILSAGQSCASTTASLLPSVAVGNLTLVSSASATVTFLAPDLLTAQVTGLVCYYRATAKVWTPVYLAPAKNPTADFTIDVLQPHSFVVTPSAPMLGTTILVTFSGSGLNSKADQAFLTTSGDNNPCTVTSSTDSVDVFTCTMSSAEAGTTTTPVCTVGVNTEANEALELSICYKKSGIANYAELSGSVSVAARVPTYDVIPTPVFAGQTISLKFGGTTLSANDRVKLVASGASCDTAAASNAVDILATTTLGQYQVVGQANLCLRVCYYLASSATWIISGPASDSQTGATSSCDANSLYIAPFPLRYQIATAVTSTNSGVGLTVDETTTVALTMDTTAWAVAMQLDTTTESLIPVSAKVVKTPNTCVTTLCGSTAACAQAQDPTDYVSSVYGSTQHTLTLMVATPDSNYVLCLQVAGLEGVYIPVLPVTATSAADLDFGFTAGAANPTLTQLAPQTWRAWMSTYTASFSGANLNPSSDSVYLISASSMISSSTTLVCPLPRSTGSLSTVLTSSVGAGSSSTVTVATFSSGQSLITGQEMYMCYLWTAGTQQRMTYVGSVTVESPVPSSYLWGLQPTSGYRAGNPFTLTLNSNSSVALSAVNDKVYFYRFTLSLSAQSCFCSASTCSSGTLVDYLSSDPSETSFSNLSPTSVEYRRTVGFDNYGYAAFYVACYTPYSVGVNTYLGVLSVGMADPAYYVTSLADGASPRVGAALTITAYACTAPGCIPLTSTDSLLLAPTTMSCADVVDITSVKEHVKVVRSATAGAGGATFSQILVPLKEGSYRVCFRSSDSTASGKYSELVYSKNYVRQSLQVQAANPSAFTPSPTAPTAGQFLTISLTCTSTRCDKCQTLRLITGADQSCWEAPTTTVYSSSNCLSSTTTYQFPNVFLPKGSFTVCLNDTTAWTSARRVPGTLVVGAANPSLYASANEEDNTIVTDQSVPYYINITGSSLSATGDEAFLLTVKGYTCHDLRNADIQNGGLLAQWFAPSVHPNPLLATSTGVDWLVSDRDKRFGAGLLLSTTLCPGDNKDCEMQLCYKRQGTSWAPVPLAVSQPDPIYVIASNPYKAEFDQYPLIVNMYTMVTVSGTGLKATDTLTLYDSACDSGVALSASVTGLTPVISKEATTWRGVIRIIGSGNPVSVCYTRVGSPEVTEIMVVRLTPADGSTPSDTILPIQWPPLYYLLNPANFSTAAQDGSYALTIYEEMQVQATFVAGGAALSPLLSAELITSTAECNYPPFVVATGSTSRLPVVNTFELMASSASTSSAMYQVRLYLPGGVGGNYALCMRTTAGYFRVTQLAPASSSASASTSTAVVFGNASPASFSFTPSYPTIGQTIAFTFTSSASSTSTSSATAEGHLAKGDIVELIDGSLFECGFHNSTLSVAQAVVSAGTPTTTTTSTTASLFIPFDTSLMQEHLTVCYRKAGGTFATVPLNGVVDKNFALVRLSPAHWTSSPTQAIVDQPLSITFSPPASATTADTPLSASDVAFLVELPEGVTTTTLTSAAGNDLCQSGTPALSSKGTVLVYNSTVGTTRWDIASMPASTAVYVVCYVAQANGQPIYVNDPATLTLYPRQSPTGVYTNRGTNDIWQGERFYLFFDTAEELNVKLEDEVTSSASTTDVVRMSSTIDCSTKLPMTAFQSIPTAFGYKPLTEINSAGIVIPYLHLRVRADVGTYYVCMKRAKRDPSEVYYNFRVVGGPNYPAILTVGPAPIASFSTVPTSPRAWVPSTSVTPTYGETDISVNNFVQMFFVPFTGDSSLIGTSMELTYDDCYRPVSSLETTGSTIPLVSTTLQVTLPELVTAFPFPKPTYYLLCYQVKNMTNPNDVLFIASVYPSTVVIKNPSPTAYLVPDLLTVQRSFLMGFTAMDPIFTITSNNQAHIYVAPSAPQPGDTTPPSCVDGAVPSDSQSSFTSFSRTNTTYASVEPLLASENYYYVCFLTSGQDHMFPVPNYKGGYYFSVGIHGPQSYTIQPRQPFLGSTATITVSGSYLSAEDHIKVVNVMSGTSPNDYKNLCTSSAPNADVTSTSSTGLPVVPGSGALSAVYAPRLNATGTYVLCYQSMLLDNQWLYVSPLTSFDVQDAHPSSYLQDPIPSYATAVNSLILRDSAGRLTTSVKSLKLVRRGAGDSSGFDCTDSAIQSSQVGLLAYRPEESSTSYATFSVCTTAAVDLTVCYKLDVAGSGWAEVPFRSPPPTYLFEGAAVIASPFQNAPTLAPSSPRPYSTFVMRLASTDALVEAQYVSFARYPQTLCGEDIPYVHPLYYAKDERYTNTYNVSLPQSGSYVVYIGVTDAVAGPNVTLQQPLVVGGCDPCTFTPPYAMAATTVPVLFRSATGDSLSNGDKLRLIPISQGLDGQPCQSPTGPYKDDTFSPTAAGTGGSTTTFSIPTGTTATATIYEGGYYACYKRANDDDFAVVANTDGVPEVFSILPLSGGVIKGESCPASGAIYGLETVTFNLTSVSAETYPDIGFNDNDEMVLLQPAALPASGCKGITGSLSDLHSKYPQAVVIPTRDSFTSDASNWYGTMLNSRATSYTPCFRLAYTSTFYSVTSTPELLTISGSGLLSTDNVFLVSASEGDCVETCYRAAYPKDWAGVSIERVSVATQELQLKVTNKMSTTHDTAVVLRLCYRRTGHYLTELGEIYIGEQNPTAYTVNFVPRVGTRPTLTFSGKHLTETDRVYLVGENDYCVADNAVAYGAFNAIDQTSTGTNGAVWTSFLLPLHVSIAKYRVCYVLSTINAGVPVGDPLDVLAGGPSAFASSNTPMEGRATVITFPTTTTSVYEAQKGDSAYIACVGCSCYDEKEATVAYGSASGTFETDPISMRVGFSNTEVYPVCYKVKDSGYALVSNVSPETSSPRTVVAFPSPTYQGQRLRYNFSNFTEAAPAVRTDGAMLVTQRRLCWETPSMSPTDVMVAPAVVASLSNGGTLWDGHVPSVGPDTPSAALFPLAYTMCYRETGQEEYVAVPYPHTTTSWMGSPNPATYGTSPSRVGAGMMGVVVTFPDAQEGDEVYLVAYNPKSNTVCTDADSEMLVARAPAYPVYKMDMPGGAPVSMEGGVFCYIRKGATVAEVPQLLAIYAGNPAGYTTNITAGYPARLREYIAFTVTGSSLSSTDRVVFTEKPCAQALASINEPSTSSTTTTTTTTSSTSAPSSSSDKTAKFDAIAAASTALLARLSDLEYAADGNSVAFVAQFMNVESETQATAQVYMCYVHEDVWTEVGVAVTLEEPEPLTATLYHASAGSILDAPLRVRQHLQIQLSGANNEAPLQAAVISGNDKDPQSWCNNFTTVQEPGLVMTNAALLSVPVWAVPGAARLCLLGSHKPWADAGTTIYSPTLLEVFPGNPTAMTVYPVVPRVGQRVTLTFHLLVKASKDDVVKIIPEEGAATPPCESATPVEGLGEAFVTVVDNLTTTYTPLDSTDPLDYRSFHASGDYRVCYYSIKEEVWSVVWLGSSDEQDELHPLHIYPLAPQTWDVNAGSLVMGRMFQLAFHETDEKDILHPAVDEIWAVPSNLNCAVNRATCTTCINFTIDTEVSGATTVITKDAGTTVVDTFHLCYQLQDATPAVIPDSLVIANATVECSLTQQVIIGEQQIVTFQKEDGADVKGDSWRVSFFAVDAALGCEARYAPGFVAARAKQTETTNTIVSYAVEWPVSLTDEKYVICYDHKGVVGPVCTCAQLQAKSGECYLQTLPGSPAEFSVAPFPAYVGQYLTITFTLDASLTAYPPTAVKFVEDKDPYLTTCQGDDAFTPQNPILTKVSDTTYTYAFQHDYKVGSAKLLVCALTARSSQYARVSTTQGLAEGVERSDNVLFIRPYMTLSTFPSLAQYIRAMQTISLNFTHASHLKNDVVSLQDEIFFTTDPYQCTATYINAQNPEDVLKVVDVDDSAFNSVPADVSSINMASKSSSSFITFGSSGGGKTYYMCYKLANGGTWAPVLPAVDVLVASVGTCSAKKPTSTANSADDALRAMQYIETTLVGGETFAGLANPAVDAIRFVAQSQPCVENSGSLYDTSVAATSTSGTFTTVVFAPSAGLYKVCYRFGGPESTVANWSPMCQQWTLVAPTPTGETEGCFAVRQAIEVSATQRTNYVFTTADTFRFIPGDEPCVLPTFSAVSPSNTITVNDASQTTSGVSPSADGGEVFNVPYALFGTGTTSMRLCYTDHEGNQFAVPIQYTAQPQASSFTVQASQPMDLLVQEKLEVGQRIMVKFSSSGSSTLPLTPYATIPDPFTFAPAFNGTFDASALLALGSTVYRDGRCIAAAKAAAASETNPLGLLGVYGPVSRAFTYTGFAPTVAATYITCYRMPKCLVTDVGSALTIHPTNPSSTATVPALPRRGQLIEVDFMRNSVDASVQSLTPGQDRGIKQANLLSCWDLSPTAGTIVKGTSSKTYFTAFFPAQSPSKASNTSTTTCYLLVGGSWSSVPNGVADVLPANPTSFSTVPEVPRADQLLQLELTGDGLKAGDRIKIISGVLQNCSDDALTTAGVVAYREDGTVVEPDGTAGFEIPTARSDGKLATLPFSVPQSGEYSVCYRLAADAVWTLVYGTLAVEERSPSTVTMTPVSVLETELFTLHFVSAESGGSASKTGTLQSTDRVVMYAGENVNCLNPGDAVSIHASPSNVAGLPVSIDFQLDMGTRGVYTLCYLSTTSTSGSEVTRVPIWGFNSITARPDPVSVSMYPERSGNVNWRAKEMISLVFTGFGLVAEPENGKTDQVKLLNASEYPTATDELCRSASMDKDITLFPLYANGTHAVQVFTSASSSSEQETAGQYWVCYKLNGGQYHHIGEKVSVVQQAMPSGATTGKSLLSESSGSAASYAYFDGETIPWTLEGNTPCSQANPNYMFYSSNGCADVPYYVSNVSTQEQLATYFPLGFAPVSCKETTPTSVRIASGPALRQAWGMDSSTSTASTRHELSLCYYYGPSSSSGATVSTTLPSVTLLGEVNSIPVEFGVPPALSSPLAVTAMAPFSFTLSVVPGVDDYLVLVRNPEDCEGVVQPTDAALFIAITVREANGDMTATAAVPSAGTYHICYSHRVGVCAAADRDCARIVGIVQAAAPSPSAWTGTPSTVYTTDDYAVAFHYPSEGAAAAGPKGKAWMSAVTAENPSMVDVYRACHKTLLSDATTTSSTTTTTITQAPSNGHSARGDLAIDLRYDSATDNWVSESPFTVNGLHALCYTDESGSKSLHLFGPITYAGPMVLSSEVLSAEWTSTPVLVEANSTVVLNGGGLTSKDELTAVGYDEATIPGDICTNSSYQPRVSADLLTSSEMGRTSITRTVTFKSSGSYVLCFRSAAWPNSRSPEVISSLGGFSVLPNVLTVTVEGDRQYVGVPLTMLFTGSGLVSNDKAALIYAAATEKEAQEKINSEICGSAQAHYGELKDVAASGQSASLTVTPVTAGVHAICFKGASSAGDAETVLLPTTVMVYTITAVEAIFSVQPACDAARLCQSQPSVQLRDSSGTLASTPNSTAVLWLVDSSGNSVTTEAGLGGATTYFFENDYTTFRFISVSLFKEGTYRMKANVTLPSGSVLIATSNLFEVSDGTGPQSIAELSCTPVGILSDPDDKITCIVTTLTTTHPSTYVVAVQPGTATECETMDSPSEAGLPRCQFAVTPSTIATNYVAISVAPGDPYSSWPVRNSPTVIRLPRTPDASSILSCKGPSYSPPLPSADMVRQGDSLNCAAQGMAVVNGVAQGIVALPDFFSIRHFVNDQSGSMKVVDLGSYPEGYNGRYTFYIPVNSPAAHKITVAGQVRTSTVWSTMQGSPQVFVVLGAPTTGATILSCASSVTGSSTYISPTDKMSCVLAPGNSAGKVQGLLQDFSVTMPSGGSVGNLPETQSPSETLGFSVTAPTQPGTVATPPTSRFRIVVNYNPSNDQVADKYYGLVFVTNVITSPLPNFAEGSQVTLSLVGSGLVLTHHYRAVPDVTADVCNENAGTSATASLSESEDVLELQFTVPSGNSFSLCYRPSDGKTYERLLPQSFLTAKGSEVVWTKTNIILLALGVAFLAILLVLLIILICRICCVRGHTRELERSNPEGYVPPRLNDRYVHQAPVNPVAVVTAPSLPPLPPRNSQKEQINSEEVDVTRVNINIQDRRAERAQSQEMTQAGKPTPVSATPPTPIPLATRIKTETEGSTTIGESSTSGPSASGSKRHRHRRRHRSSHPEVEQQQQNSLSPSGSVRPPLPIIPPPTSVTTPLSLPAATPLSDALLDYHRHPAQRQSEHGTGSVLNPTRVNGHPLGDPWSPRETVGPAVPVGELGSSRTPQSLVAQDTFPGSLPQTQHPGSPPALNSPLLRPSSRNRPQLQLSPRVLSWCLLKTFRPQSLLHKVLHTLPLSTAVCSPPQFQELVIQQSRW